MVALDTARIHAQPDVVFTRDFGVARWITKVCLQIPVERREEVALQANGQAERRTMVNVMCGPTERLVATWLWPFVPI